VSDAKQPADSQSSTGARIGQIVVIVGLLFLYGVGAYWLSAEMILEEDVPWWLKIGLPSVVVGTTILFVIVLRQRIKATKTDKYLDVKD